MFTKHFLKKKVAITKYNFGNAILFFFFLFFAYSSVAQDSIPKIKGDSLYREDQFYIGITYNLLISTTGGVNPEGLSGGINFGFIRDMPLNKKRNVAVGIGLGVSVDQYGTNLFIDKDENENTLYTILDSEVNYKYNRFKTAVIEAPLEFRWRTSTATDYRFWRVYAGFKVGYTFWHRTSYKDGSKSISHSDISEFEKLRMGTTISLGYNKFNFFAYYSLYPFLSDNAYSLEGQQVNFNSLKLGLIFYIL